MVRQISVREAETLLAVGGVDLVDVREPHEWDVGHLPSARNVPLALVQADPKGTLKADKVVFVCARGGRSLRAASVADEAGQREVYSIDGGTEAWAAAGFPLEMPARVIEKKPAPTTEPVGDASCGLPEPGLDAVVGANLKALRAQRGLSLDALAQLTGLSRTVLGQIELGHANPSVNMVWKIARAFDVHFSALLASATPHETKVMRAPQAKRLVSADGRYSSRALFPLSDKPGIEFYELFLAPHSREDAQPHQPGTRENLIVGSGRLELHVGSERFELAKGDAIVFAADVTHAYVNPSAEECWLYLVMTYGSSAGQG